MTKAQLANFQVPRVRPDGSFRKLLCSTLQRTSVRIPGGTVRSSLPDQEQVFHESYATNKKYVHINSNDLRSAFQRDTAACTSSYVVRHPS